MSPNAGVPNIMTQPIVQACIAGQCDATTLDLESLLIALDQLNSAYRAGQPLVSDDRYDHEFLARLRDLAPGHPYLQRVESEPAGVFGEEMVPHPFPMLSTEKAYTDGEVERFVERLARAARELGLSRSDQILRATMKLDGQGARFDGSRLYTRGNYLYGYEITRAIERGLVMVSRGASVGEVVVLQSYFDENLADEFESPRNFVIGAISADEPREAALLAYQAGALRFVSYDTLPNWTGFPDDFLREHHDIRRDLHGQTPYLVDGLVVEATTEALRRHLGSTSHHHRYMLAVKEKGTTAEAVVRGVTWHTGRTGRVTPVLRIDPVTLSGATLQNVTAHHAGIVQTHGLGVGARIEVIRSGEVIPKIEKILETSAEVAVPEVCPSCGHGLEWEGDKFLACGNTLGCPAQVENGLRHFFHILGTADLFGPRTIEKLVAGGVTTLPGIYALTESDFLRHGFGHGQSDNLVRELARSRVIPVEDWRFLAAFGIRHLGRGDSRKLLAVIPLGALERATTEAIRAIPGFGVLTSEAVARGIRERLDVIRHLIGLGFNLILSEPTSAKESPIAGMGVVFTGTMRGGSREAMETEARSLGAQVQSSVSGITRYLVCGEKCGASKLNKARSLGVTLLTEAEYRKMIA